MFALIFIFGGIPFVVDDFKSIEQCRSAGVEVMKIAPVHEGRSGSDGVRKKFVQGSFVCIKK